MTEMTIVHLLRHGEVHNPRGVLYGRLPGYHLSETGRRMAEVVAKAVESRDIVAVWSSPMERAQETAAPSAKALGLEVVTDERLTEAGNVFEGLRMAGSANVFRDLRSYRHFRNPFRPSWGEPYRDVVARMKAVVDDARAAARGHEALLVSHQLPIWVIRLAAEGRRLWHDPRRRQCALASLTSLTFEGNRLISIGYSEPAGALLRAGAEPQGEAALFDKVDEALPEALRADPEDEETPGPRSVPGV
ncbi:phosphoglycerate mutase [Microbispora rosea subsp. aerata]|nr:histidine phosphatase family protein [Microbispora rosea]GGO13947.1 phosphoglycerate mutase [Microbispora rosea subsp. aerata]GIH53910.1 phosphoglycerate mutase [Microbispora rosea subsp. aerata]GLJ84882.1 phosphoglycerate mutase [Microbispora rosea subsp. aerata]